MAEKYVRCDGHCKYPAYDKEDINEMMSDIYKKEEVDNKMTTKQNTVLSGTTEPDNSLGVDGDIYLKYDKQEV